MKRYLFALSVLLVSAVVLLAQSPGQPAKVTPKLEAIAETRLLMEGLAHANFRGLERLLKKEPADVETWTFARGQAILIAETANLLMLRPPRNQGQAPWFDQSMQLRAAANQLAVSLGNKEYEKSRSGLLLVSQQCNRCHQTFRIPVEITPFADPPPPKLVDTE